MKKLIAIALICLTWHAMSQEVEIRQTIGDKINTLNINRGWDVRFIQTQEDTTSSISPNNTMVSIIVPEELEQLVQERSPLEYKNKTLTLKENDYLPQGTIVEISSPFNFSITLKSHATVKTDHFFNTNYLNIDIDAYFSAKCFHSKAKYTSIKLGYNATFEVDTLQGICKIFDYDGMIRVRNFQQEELYIIEERAIYSNEHHHPSLIPEGEFVDPENKYIQNDTIRNITVEHFHYSSIDQAKIYINLGYYYTSSYSGNEEFQSSPYYSRQSMGMRVPITLEMPLNKNWNINFGIQYDMVVHTMWHMVAVDENDHLGITRPEVAQQNTLIANYLGLPFEIVFQDRQFDISTKFGFDITPSIRCGSSRLGALHFNELWAKKGEKVSVLNRFKLEIGLSMWTNLFGRGYKFRIFTNLLPQYNKESGAPKAHSVGLEWYF
ncbi:MAG: hypothetical protein KBT45_07595 [Bacteroidales bacterium]|nr:hypothetical protein [Candidatus Colimorpha pelethequi]